MSKSNHSEAQMIGALKQLEAGRKAGDVAAPDVMRGHSLGSQDIRRSRCP